VDPPCTIVDRCGGCPVQHVAYPSQLAAKQELSADALERIGGFPAGATSWRPSFRARCSSGTGGARACIARPEGAGLRQRGVDRMEPVDECLLFEPRLQELANVARAAGALPE